jgi:hypothetical protein
MTFVTGRAPSQKQFRQNLMEKMTDQNFLNDTTGLLRTNIPYIPDEAFQVIEENLITKMI